ncbi:T9SS type A sorting domain-containing protein [Ferruginibacter albus]|uniref:T9SS type A sorting domain-containing protein n=1 Tax=Ferruginibacter albus TaxID=2875540 RepID=UPI001CC6472D|nr:T9SS type A sorting domain-containing protein [Ferruginibacter albus]UAY52775.1 T9SS type A sorting domain-containing protein [Ferruginibacter albus]
MSNGYYEYLPTGYSTSGRAYPLLIFMHGLGELGDGSPSQLPYVLRNGPPMQINNGTFPESFTVNGQVFRFIVLSPQFTQWPTPVTLDSFINYAMGHYRVDVTRIYLTGLSMGGGAVWDYAGNSVATASRLAAIVPISGASWPDVTHANNIAKGNIAVWATHNSGDPTVPVSYTEDYVSEINSAPSPPNPLAKMTIFNQNYHDAWTQTYDLNYRENGLNVYEWMLQFKRGNTIVLPVTGLSIILEPSNNGVMINWKTYTEINTSGFEIERSSDGINYIPVGSSQSSGNETTGGTYNYFDASTNNGKNYYRIKIIDKNGNFTYSSVKMIDMDNTISLRLYPNPASNIVTIKAGSNFSNAQIKVLNSAGQMVMQKLVNGTNIISIPVTGLQSGSYFINVLEENGYKTRLSFIKN